MKDDDDDVDAREGACSMETAMLSVAWERRVWGAVRARKGGCVCCGASEIAKAWEQRGGFVCAPRWSKAVGRRLRWNCSGRARPASRQQQGSAIN